MIISVRYFASIRELAGTGKTVLDLPDGATVENAIDQLADSDIRMHRAFSACLTMVNQEYVNRDHALADGDELAFIPPVSGGSIDTDRDVYSVTESPLNTETIQRLVADDASGAIALFVGTVRDHARGHRVIRLDYEAYEPAAEKMLARIGAEIRERWSVGRIAIIHRFGSLVVGESSVIIGISSPHRGEAFDATRYAIERIKEIVPIWKKEWYEGGSSWIGSEADYQREIRTHALNEQESG
ncbi:molybdenum cofactor biosynthesis protein MoaE [soil metagenome]